jgi:hypothetical protein
LFILVPEKTQSLILLSRISGKTRLRASGKADVSLHVVVGAGHKILWV